MAREPKWYEGERSRYDHLHGDEGPLDSVRWDDVDEDEEEDEDD